MGLKTRLAHTNPRQNNALSEVLRAFCCIDFERGRRLKIMRYKFDQVSVTSLQLGNISHITQRTS